MSSVIKVENLSKKYVLQHQKQERYSALRDVIANGAKGALGKLYGKSELKNVPEQEDFWALKDINFEIKQGERVGIIGRNGAGKSTLLKILSRITEPTSGRVSIKGRVANLLEVGTGFHPELTGRENIYLNGAILGMTKAEIKSKFDEIVSFAEVERFLDTPVKRYSSGMYVRLAFSVAAHLETEILVVDEVLAVGDVQFQKKCLGKMDDVARDGKTILLVSHNMPTILGLSEKALLLDGGKLIDFGDAHHVVSRFQDGLREGTLGQVDLSRVERYGNGLARFRSIKLEAINHQDQNHMLVTGSDLIFLVEIEPNQDAKDITVALTIYDEVGNRLIDVNTLIKGDAVDLKEGKVSSVRFHLKNVCLKPDLYTVGLWMGIINQFDVDGVRYATSFRVDPKKQDVLYTSGFPGVYYCDFEHKVIY